MSRKVKLLKNLLNGEKPSVAPATPIEKVLHDACEKGIGSGGGGGMKTFELDRNEGDFFVKDEDREALIEAVKNQERIRFLFKQRESDSEGFEYVQAAAFEANYLVEFEKDNLCGDLIASKILFDKPEMDYVPIYVSRVEMTEAEYRAIASAWGIE